MGATVAVVVVGTIAPSGAAVDLSSTGHVPAGEAQALQAAGAYGAHPVRFLFVGDSLSVTMGIGLQVGTVHRYGVTVINKGVLGCDIDDLPTISTTNGQQDDPVSSCAHWETLWGSQVAQFRPEVVGVLIGRWDILDHVDGDRIVHIGEPAWDRHLDGGARPRRRGALVPRGARGVLHDALPGPAGRDAERGAVARGQPDPGRRVQPPAGRGGGAAPGEGDGGRPEPDPRALGPLPGARSTGSPSGGPTASTSPSRAASGCRPASCPTIAQLGLDVRAGAGTS